VSDIQFYSYQEYKCSVQKKKKKDKDNVERIDSTQKKNENKIVFDNDIQNKITVFVLCLIVVGKIK